MVEHYSLSFDAGLERAHLVPLSPLFGQYEQVKINNRVLTKESSLLHHSTSSLCEKSFCLIRTWWDSLPLSLHEIKASPVLDLGFSIYDEREEVSILIWLYQPIWGLLT